MKPITDEWVAKAEGDFLTAQREKDVVPAPNYDAAVFHAQQCAEKYLKARLVEAGIEFPKTHDLAALLEFLLPVEPSWETFRSELNALTDMGIEVRYPGATADSDDAGLAVETACRVRAAVRSRLALAT